MPEADQPITPEILVVDDDAEVREMLSRHFRFSGYEVHLAENGVEALQILPRHRIQVVVSDVQMPEMDGVELLRQVREHFPMVRVIMMTGYVTLNNVLSCWRRGADTCVFKPFDNLDELESAVERALAAQKNWLRILNELREMKPRGN